MITRKYYALKSYLQLTRKEQIGASLWLYLTNYYKKPLSHLCSKRPPPFKLRREAS